MEKIFLNKKILLTRSLEESKEFKKLLLKANFPGEVVIFPLLEIQYLEPKLELENYDVLIATSIHALKKYKNSLINSNLQVFSVGKRTNDFLEKQGVNKLFNYNKDLWKTILVNKGGKFKAISNFPLNPVDN